MHQILICFLISCCTVAIATHQVASDSAVKAQLIRKIHAEQDPTLVTQQQAECRHVCVGLHEIAYCIVPHVLSSLSAGKRYYCSYLYHNYYNLLCCTVLCRTRRAQVIACSSLLHHDQRAWAADAAPNSEELVWANLG